MYSDYPQNPEYNKELSDKEEANQNRKTAVKMRRFYYLTFILVIVVTAFIYQLY